MSSVVFLYFYVHFILLIYPVILSICVLFMFHSVLYIMKNEKQNIHSTNLKDISLKNNPEVVQELIEKNIKCC